jgi:hypothetical protein
LALRSRRRLTGVRPSQVYTSAPVSPSSALQYSTPLLAVREEGLLPVLPVRRSMSSIAAQPEAGLPRDMSRYQISCPVVPLLAAQASIVPFTAVRYWGFESLVHRLTSRKRAGAPMGVEGPERLSE